MNTMQYGTDGFEFKRRALLKSAAALDFTQETSVAGFNIGGTQPAGTERRVIFEIDGKLYRFVNGALDVYTERGEFADVITGGNTVEELMALDTIPGFVGKRVYPIIALEAPADAAVMPRIKIAAKVNSYNDVYTKAELSPIYQLTGNARIVDVNVQKSTTGNAKVEVKFRVKNPLTGWSDWQSDIRGKRATAVQIQATHVLTTLDGTDLSNVDGVQIKYVTDAESSAADFFELVTQPQEFDANLGTCYALVKHDELQDCQIQAYVTFGAPNQHRELSLGNATGNVQTFNLPDNFIDQSTLVLEIGGRVVQHFHYDTGSGAITFTGAAGKPILVSYDFGSEENWREMALDSAELYQTRFIYRLAETTLDTRVSAVKVRLTKKSGRAEETFGVGTGTQQTFATEHRATNLECNVPCRYDSSTRILRTLAPIGEQIEAAYDWQGDFPAVKQVVCGWQAR